MLFLIYGNDWQRARAKTREILDALQKKKPDAAVVHLEEREVSKDKFDEPVKHCLGFSLIKRSVFETMTPPWFVVKEGQGTEDIEFFKIVGGLGLKVVRDDSLVAEHLGVFSNRDEKLRLNQAFINTL